MRILVLTQGWYGERIAQHIRQHRPGDWEVEAIGMAGALPQIIEEPEDHIPPDVPNCQLLIALSESPQMSGLVPGLARASGACAVIAPIDDSKWLPRGLRNSLRGSLSQMGIGAAFPKTFCALEANTGEGPIDEFAALFGQPRLEIRTEGDRIREARVTRGAPCGCTHFVAQRLCGLRVEEAELRAGLLFHNYPCLASMERDNEYGDSLMHISAYALKAAVRRALDGGPQPQGPSA